MLFVFLLSPLTYAADCGNVFSVQYGPYDYTSRADGKMLRVVEKRHFTKRVEMLVSGESSSEIMDDLHYTLNKFPNHYRALMSLVKYEELKEGELPQTGAPFRQSVDCYFARAFQFKPNSWRLHHIYGIHFYKRGEYEKAIQEFLRAEEINPTAEINYNLGLSYFKVEDYEKASAYASRAYKDGYPLPGLKNMLRRQGVELTQAD